MRPFYNWRGESPLGIIGSLLRKTRSKTGAARLSQSEISQGEDGAVERIEIGNGCWSGGDCVQDLGAAFDGTVANCAG